MYHLKLGSIDYKNRPYSRKVYEAITQTPGILPSEYLLMVDTWEGQGMLDVSALKAGGVAGAFIRLNNISGGHHMDANFRIQWDAIEDWVKIPYFVYSPWVDGKTNFEKLSEFMPTDSAAAMIDVEVSRVGYSKTTYAQQLETFKNLAKNRWNIINYTAEWFLANLAYWPKDVPYWWAQYPNSLYVKMSITWDKLRELLVPYSYPSNSSKCPGTIEAWQCSGDKIILPGSDKPIDVNVVYMSLPELKNFAGNVVETPAFEWTQEKYDALYNKLVNIEELVSVAVPAPSLISEWTLKNKGIDSNHLYKVYKVPDISDTNTEQITDNNTLMIINNWSDVPGGLPYWNARNDIDKQNIYRNWACIMQKTIMNINGALRPFPSIKYADGSTATHVWIERVLLDTKK